MAEWIPTYTCQCLVCGWRLEVLLKFTWEAGPFSQLLTEHMDREHGATRLRMAG